MMVSKNLYCNKQVYKIHIQYHYFYQKNIIHHTNTFIHTTSHSLIYIQDTLSLIHYIHHIPSHQRVCGGRHRSLHSISSLSYPLTLTLLWCHLEKRLQTRQSYYDLRRDTHVNTNHIHTIHTYMNT